jgi:3',5'-cyclic AMP phosphodiesterase CpdA
MAATILRRIMHGFALAFLLAAASCGGAPKDTTPAEVTASQSIADPVVELPNQKDSVKFAVLGDFGTGDREQYELGAQMARLHKTFKYETVVTVGDNLYGRQSAKDFKKKFELPYKELLDAGVKFYASLGNHDLREQPSYKLFNMEGKLYYTLKLGDNVRFFMLDTNYMTPEQMEWLKKELDSSGSDWKITVFHHPLYSSGARHGSDKKLRELLEPVFVEHDVSVVLQGHDHFYERIKPQRGIVYFVAGSGGKLRRGDIDRSTGLTAKGFDTALAFMAVEIIDDRMYFNAITTNGSVVDSGIIERRMQPDEKEEKTPASSSSTRGR